jgi:alpha-amylase
VTVFVLAVASLLSIVTMPLWGQAGFGDDRVMLQGFYWESPRFGHSMGNKVWYEIVASDAATIANANFDLVWMPPPAYAGEMSVGYNPKQLFRLDNSYGSLKQHRAAMVALLQNGLEPVADIVVNHRDGTSGWADFQNPVWGTV